MDAYRQSFDTGRCRIRIGDPAPSAAGDELLAALAELFPVRFCRDAAGDAAGEIRLACPSGDAERGGSLPSLTFAATRGSGEMHDIEVQFADSPEVPLPFRGRRLRTRAVLEEGLALRGDERTLAASPEGPLWSVAERAGTRHFRSAMPLPPIAAGGIAADLFNGERFLELLPLMHFLREAGAASAWQLPPLRAAFVIDDPNLHWPHYGGVDYRQLAAHAERENYHVAIATIPLDAWYTHLPTAQIFRQHRQRLSLVVHGNNHARAELAAAYAPAERARLLDQALARIRRLESRAGLTVCRVMVPPHGACSGDMLAALPAHGFESACISTGSLRAFNSERQWTRSLGFLPAEVVEGCPVLPRWGLTGSLDNALLVAAYLGRPLIVRAHQADLKDGPGVFDARARFINGLGEVLWSDLSGLGRRSYLWRMEGTTLRVRPLAATVALEPPGVAETVVVEAPGEAAWRIRAGEAPARLMPPGKVTRLPAAGRIVIERLATAPPPLPAGFGRTSARLVCRRLLTEARDRLWD